MRLDIPRWHALDSLVRVALATALARSGEVDSAILEFAAAERLGTLGARACLNYGTALTTRGRLAEAQTLFERATGIEPGYATAHFNLGLIHERRGSVEQARRHYAAAVAADPSHPAATRLAALRGS